MEHAGQPKPSSLGRRMRRIRTAARGGVMVAGAVVVGALVLLTSLALGGFAVMAVLATLG